ncbi:MAG: hypothetical protein QM722_16930 [Piscinibacter sp.]
MTSKPCSALAAAVLISLPLAATAQLPSLKNLPGLPGLPLGGNSADAGAIAGQNDSLVRGYVGANKDVLLANALMAEALGLKDQAATARATADALTEGATKGNLEDSNKAVSASTAAVAEAMAKHPQLDAQSKATYQSGLAKLAQGVIRYVKLRKPAQDFSAGLKGAAPTALPKLQSGIYIVSQLPGGISNLATSLQNATAFAKSNDIPVPPDATQALASL